MVLWVEKQSVFILIVSIYIRAFWLICIIIKRMSFWQEENKKNEAV